MANFFQNITDWFNKKSSIDGNLMNRAAYEYIGGQAATYDYDNKTYLEKGYGFNPDVFSIINQQSKKVASIPFYIKKIVDENAKANLDKLQIATKGNYSIEQLARKKILEAKAFSEQDLKFPLARPNVTQSWSDIWALYQVYMKTTGNAYLYIVSPDEGNNKGTPKEVYILPSHLVKIVLKKNANLIDDESPISHYMLIEGNQYIEFPEEKIIHLKYPNPFFDLNGSQLYGLSPLRSVLRNIESSNDAINGNVKAMKNSGVFGFLTSSDSNVPLTSEQALQIKEKLLEMDRGNGRLSKIAGSAVPIQFTKLSLNTDELKPFDFLKYDQKTICNVLGWSDKLLNSDDSLTYNNKQDERKRVITDTINPDLILLSSALNNQFIPKFKGFENAVIEWDVTELPEMQEDYKAMIEWMNNSPLTPNEIRQALKYETLDTDGMDVIWIPSGKKRIDDADVMVSDVQKAYGF